MTAVVWTGLCLLGTFLFAALGDLVSEEIRGWLDLVPRAILRLAAARLYPELRESIYQGEWLPELDYVLRGAESRPITRLIRGTTFALGLLVSADRIARYATSPPKGAAGTAYGQTDPSFYFMSTEEGDVYINPILEALSADLSVEVDTLLSDEKTLMRLLQLKLITQARRVYASL